MRTTIEMQDSHRAALLRIAAERGEKGFSSIVAEAIEVYLIASDAGRNRQQAALALRGRLAAQDARDLERSAEAIRKDWR